MKTIAFLLSFIVLFSLNIKAQGTQTLLQQLDQVVEQKEQYREPRHRKIEDLKQRAASSSDKELTPIYEALVEAYSHFKTDSALYFIDFIITDKKVKGNKDEYLQAELSKAEQLAVMGAYYNAESLVLSLQNETMSHDTRTRYYHVCRTIYGWMTDYTNNAPSISNSLEKLTSLYRDSIINNENDAVMRDIVLADQLLKSGQGEKAYRLLYKHKETARNERKSYIYFTMSEVFRANGDTDMQMQYLALAAIEDLKRGVTEYTALPTLAKILMERGDINRAYNYLVCSMEDANYCNARLRSMEISQVFPIIEKAHKQQEMEGRKTGIMLMIGLSLLAILLTAAIFYLHNQMNKLSATRKKLADANSQLESANAQLESANSQLASTNDKLGISNSNLLQLNTNLQQMDQVKEEYIAKYLGRCRNYIASLETYRKSLLKLAKNNQQAELMKNLKDDTLVSDEQQRFYDDFDEAFLDIHPNFVENFNALLVPEERITPKKGERLTTELRIFALIRLGVTDTAEIAHFLDYSMPTIYNYRSRIRNKSIFSKADFDKKLMEL